MGNVLLLILLIVSIIMTGLILIQQSEGGALGIGGGGGGGGGFMSGRTVANSVSRMTAILGTVFLACCLLLSIVMDKENQQRSILDADNAEAPLTAPVDSVEDTDPLAIANDTATEAETTATSDAATSDTASDDNAEENPEKPEFE